VAQPKPSYRQALRQRDFRLLVGALSQSSMGDWAYNVALVVYVYDRTHSAGWLAASTIGRMLPRFLASLYAGVIAERFERVRVMVSADVVRAILMAGMAALVAVDAPPAVVIAVSGLLAIVASVYDPATAAMLPQLLGEDNLAAGNALTETINNLAIVVGPAVGAAVLLVGKPWVVMAIDAVTFVVSAVLVGRMKARSVPTDLTTHGGPLRQVMVGVRAITRSATASILVGFTVVTTALYGVDTVLFVFLSRDKLGTGATGYGYLLVALGVGGIVASALVNRLAAWPRLSAVLAVGMIAYAAPTAALVFVHSPVLASAIEVLRGVATLLVDVLAMTALQRSLAPEMISRVFGVFWALAIAGLGLGAFATPFLLSGLGLNRTLLVAGLVVPVLVVAVYPRLASIDRLAGARAEALAPRTRVLESLQIFAAAPPSVLERLASAAKDSTVEAGDVIITEGAPADALYVLADGEVEVRSSGEGDAVSRHIRFMTAPAYFGEIGLIRRTARTATVSAVGTCVLWRIEGDAFLSALNETTPSRLLLQGMATRLGVTHPSLLDPTQAAPGAHDETQTASEAAATAVKE
jgi:CRP-like cAMP-binding protein/predicted MFS family arabinose efflux permease